MLSVPPVELGSPPVAIAAGQFRTCALLEDESVKCWGPETDVLRDASIVGDRPNEMGDALAPLQLGTDARAIDLTAAPGLLCVRFADGRAKCAGDNSSGQLGRVTAGSESELAPAPFLDVGTERSIRALSAGGEVRGAADGVQFKISICALLDDGSVKCWGDNAHGQLGFVGPSTGAHVDDMGDRLPRICLRVRAR